MALTVEAVYENGMLKPSEPLPLNWKSYLERMPKDPWGRPYAYLNPGARGEIDVATRVTIRAAERSPWLVRPTRWPNHVPSGSTMRPRVTTLV